MSALLLALMVFMSGGLLPAQDADLTKQAVVSFSIEKNVLVAISAEHGVIQSILVDDRLLTFGPGKFKLLIYNTTEQDKKIKFTTGATGIPDKESSEIIKSGVPYRKTFDLKTAQTTIKLGVVTK